jgi:tyrosyl-tRNA synthetase
METKDQLALIKRGTTEILSEEELVKLFEENRPLKVKFGADPTAPDIHLGHVVILNKLRQFQQLGHEIHFIIGDFTARIGDPSGRDMMRPPLSEKKIKENAKTYQQQVFKILDPKKTKIYFNSEWLNQLNFSEVIKIAACTTVARMLERDEFETRFKKGNPIGIHEFLYPLIQGYDSVVLKADIEIGGTDQKFNLLMGRELQKEYGQKPQVILTLPLLEGTDGIKKMSKSYGNYVGITDPPYEMFGKIMSIPDNLITKYFYLLTSIEEEKVKKMEEDLVTGKIHPRDTKAQLAYQIVKVFWGKEEAESASAEFDRVFKERLSPKELPEFIPSVNKIKLIDLLFDARLVESKSEARRLITQGAVKIDGQKIKDLNFVVELEEEMIIKVGKRKFLKVLPPE